jgi:hypothetical protein
MAVVSGMHAGGEIEGEESNQRGRERGEEALAAGGLIPSQG